MAKKKKNQSTAPVMTRGQMSRAAQEAQRIRNLYTAGIGLGVVLLLVLGFAVVFTYLIRPNAEVARVNGQVINRDTYNKLRRWNLYQQLQQQAFQQQLGGTGVTGTEVDAIRQQLKNVENESQLDQQVLQSLVDIVVLKQKSAEKLSVNPTGDELMEAALKDFIPQPTAPPSSETPTAGPTATATFTTTFTPTPTGTIPPTMTRTATRTATPGSPTMTPTRTATLPPVPGATQTAVARYNDFLKSIKEDVNPSLGNIYCSYGCPSFTEQDYMSFIIEPRVRQEQVTEKLSASKIVTEVEQVRVQHILTDTRDGALAIKARLDAGEDFDKLVLEQSKDTGSKELLGVYDWFPREGSGFVQPFVDASFSTPVGKYGDPVESTFGFHLIRVLAREVRPLSETQIETRKQELYTNWFNEVKLESTISPSSFGAPTPTPPPLIEPTSPPAANSTATPAGAATPTGGASQPVTNTDGLVSPVPASSPTEPTTARNTPQPSPSP